MPTGGTQDDAQPAHASRAGRRPRRRGPGAGRPAAAAGARAWSRTVVRPDMRFYFTPFLAGLVLGAGAGAQLLELVLVINHRESKCQS